jgi:Fe-S cluster assembly ATP-binding protein
MLTIRNLHANINGVEILKGINLTINPGEVHAIMGPNGSGKSTLSKVIAGHPDFDVTEGEVLYNGKSILDMDPEERAREGVFMAFQYPVEVPGVNNAEFLRLAYNAKQAHLGGEEMDAFDFDEFIKDKLKLLDMDPSYAHDRFVNAGFSGGEKKRNEVLQMAVLDPRLTILDEIDSGLDIDALRIVANGVNTLMTPEKAVLVITHYQRLLDYITPDVVHVLAEGRIIKSGDKSLALELEAKGYDWLLDGDKTEVSV